MLLVSYCLFYLRFISTRVLLCRNLLLRCGDFLAKLIKIKNLSFFLSRSLFSRFGLFMRMRAHHKPHISIHHPPTTATYNGHLFPFSYLFRCLGWILYFDFRTNWHLVDLVVTIYSMTLEWNEIFKKETQNWNRIYYKLYVHHWTTESNRIQNCLDGRDGAEQRTLGTQWYNRKFYYLRINANRKKKCEQNTRKNLLPVYAISPVASEWPI